MYIIKNSSTMTQTTLCNFSLVLLKCPKISFHTADKVAYSSFINKETF